MAAAALHFGPQFRPRSLGAARFTLLELIIVLAMLLLITGVVSSGIRKIPAFVTLDDCVGKLKNVFTEASARAVFQGQNVRVVFSPDSRRFSIEGGGEGTGLGLKGVRLPKDAEIEFPDFAGKDDTVAYFFYSDGSGGGPPTKISLNGHVRLLTVSPLTGMLRSEVIDED